MVLLRNPVQFEQELKLGFLFAMVPKKAGSLVIHILFNGLTEGIIERMNKRTNE